MAKKIIDFFLEIEDSQIREKALKNYAKITPIKLINSEPKNLHHAIMIAFDFSYTPEGKSFWQTFTKSLEVNLS